ncbi:MAG TPA: M48 family metallopeptidase [Verrucomicrobiae bacterium]|nr:M48 family metallopeptidase [Verrucomicrobiae bacterium]
MDFFDRQDKARRQTKVLVVYFLLGVALLIAAIYVALVLVLQWPETSRRYIEAQGFSLWNPRLFLGTAIGTGAVILMGSLFKTLQLSRGGSAVASMLGGRAVNPNTADPDERKLLNIVEEMALASGIAVPQVYVMDEELAINAFAAGHTESDAVVGVTRGCMKLLSRDELQGVIAHEFSHILNGDMRLNLRLMGWIFGIFCISVIGRVLLHTRGGSRRDKNPLPLVGLVFLALGGIGVFFGRLIQAAVSRQREFLADAAAVQFTRNPPGLAGALKKIGGLVYGSKLESPHATEASHLFFGRGTGSAFSGLMSTHPPLEDRIRALDPSFDGTFPRVDATRETDVELEDPRARRRGGSPFPFPFEVPGLAPASEGREMAVPPVIPVSAVVPASGAPSPGHLRYAVQLRRSFSPALQTATHDSMSAMAVIYAQLLSSDPLLRDRQLENIGRLSSTGVRREVERVLPDVTALAVRARLPLVDMTLPALRQMSFAQFEEFSRAIRELIESDHEIDLFEYVLQKIAIRHIESQFKPPRTVIVQFYTMRPLAGDAAILISAMAHAGSGDPGIAAEAFKRGAMLLTRGSQIALDFVPGERCGLAEIDAALERLNTAAPQLKKNVLFACAATVAADGWIQESEAELLRGIADTLDCPLPPFIPKE